MISVEEAVARVAAAFGPNPAEWVLLHDALGRTLAEDVFATHDQPPADVSAMDGYAVRSSDLKAGQARLKRVGESAAGRGFSGTIRPGETARIFTGAPLPEGADAVAIQENAAVEGEAVRLDGAVAPGTFVRRRGLDFAAGRVGLRAGSVLGPRELGLCAAMGVVWLRVRRRPRVAILGTGDELVLPGRPLGADRIYSSNNVTLAGMVRAFGGEPSDLGVAPDEPRALAEAVAGARGCDLLVTTGGASVGEHDLIREVLGGEGLALDFWKIAMRPGKPLIFGRIGGVPLLGLPGNPVSTGVCGLLFVRAAIRVALGLDPTLSETVGTLGADLPENDRRQEYRRATLACAEDGTWTATPFPQQDSAMFRLFREADALVVRAPFAPAMRAGDRARLVVLAEHGL